MATSDQDNENQPEEVSKEDRIEERLPEETVREPLARDQPAGQPMVDLGVDDRRVERGSEGALVQVEQSRGQGRHEEPGDP